MIIKKDFYYTTYDLEEEEVLSCLQEHYLPDKIDFTELSGFHRYVFGVSHARLHIDSPNTTVIECGAGTMFSIGNPKSRTKHFQKINSTIETINPRNSILIFEFGEIDIRNSIFKVSKKTSKSIYEVASVSVQKYIDFVKIIRDRGFNVVIIGPHCGGGDNVSRVSPVERNDLCAYVNDSLNFQSDKNGFFFVTMFDKVVDQDTLKEIPSMFCDHHHLFRPPSAIGCALNSLICNRISAALSKCGSYYPFFRREYINYECTIIVSDVPGWQVGEAFNPGTTVNMNKCCLDKGKFLLLIELPFLISPKEIGLIFTKPPYEIKASVQGIEESWGTSSNEIDSVNILNSISLHKSSMPIENALRYSFDSPCDIREKCVDIFLCSSLAIPITIVLHQLKLQDGCKNKLIRKSQSKP